MTGHDEVEKALEGLGQALGPDDSFASDVMQRIEADAIRREPQSVGRQRLKRKAIMSRGIEIAVAAVVVIAVLVGARYLTGSLDVATRAYGITEAAELLGEARTVHAVGRIYFPHTEMPDGSEVPPVPLERWVDLDHGRERCTTTGLSSGKEDVTVGVGELIQDRQYWLRLNHTEKTARFTRLGKYHQMCRERTLANGAAHALLGDIKDLASSVKIGEQETDGVLCQIWQWERVNQVTGSGQRTRCWFSPATGVTKRVESWTKWRHTDWGLREECDRIELNVEIPDWVFAMEVPEGYEARNTKETAMFLPVGSPNMGGYADEKCSLSYGQALSFTLSDGSVIWGWSSIDKSSQRPPEEYFEGLVFGGPLPKLPIQFNTLKPGGVASDISYTGHHLAHTRGGDRFTEWSIYVPDGTPPESIREFGYDAKYIFNLGHTPGLRIGLPVAHGMLIGTPEDFDTWVLGAMAELSDDGTAPEGITFERALELAAAIRRDRARRGRRASD
jgi:hypothetical protein